MIKGWYLSTALILKVYIKNSFSISGVYVTLPVQLYGNNFMIVDLSNYLNFIWKVKKIPINTLLEYDYQLKLNKWSFQKV